VKTAAKGGFPEKRDIGTADTDMPDLNQDFIAADLGDGSVFNGNLLRMR